MSETITEQGYTIDARQANSNIKGSIAETIKAAKNTLELLTGKTLNIDNMLDISHIFSANVGEAALFYNWSGNSLTPIYSMTLKIPSLDPRWFYGICLSPGPYIHIAQIYSDQATIDWKILS